MTTADTIRLDQLDSRIRSVWGRGQTLHLLKGLLAFCRWAIPLFVLGVLIDWLTYMPTPGRVVILLVMLSVSFYQAWRCGWRHLRSFDVTRTALQIEAHHGELKSLLISAVQLRREANSGGGSDALRLHTCRLAEEAASGIRPEQTVPYRPLKRPGVIALVLAGLIAVFAALNGTFLTAGIARIFTPWVSIEYPTNTQITLDPSEIVVKEGDSALIEANIGGVIPKHASILVKTGEGRAREIDLEIADGSCVYTIDSASRDFTYRINAGDDRTGWQSVRVVPAPRVERVKVDLAYPAYLGRPQETIEALTLTVPEGTDVNWQLTLDRSISAAQLIRDGEEPVDLSIGDDGRAVTFSDQVTASRGYNFTWVEKQNGFTFTSPRYYLQVASDQAPRVELTSPSANLVAMLGRPLDLAIRVQDDHGIGSTTVNYRVNQFDENAIELASPAKSGQGDQPIDWDYRRALPDLEVGDRVSFAVQVSDRYPGREGPHRVRSETRRITFLSKEKYLEQIEKQKDRLLSRVQTIYRQERSAHEIVRDLAPDRDGYVQACQLEAIRQEMVRDQIKEIAGQMQALLADLEANNVSDAAEGEALEHVRTALLGIADMHIANAATLLREQSATVADPQGAEGPATAASVVNTAARELGRIVLLRGIESAQEVYAREARMLAQLQAALRWRTVISESAGDSEKIAKEQDELAQWTEQLVSDLQAGMRYDKRPLAVLRLTRSVKDLHQAATEAKMREAGGLIRQEKADQAASLQAELVRTLLNAEFSVRLSGSYTTLMRTRDQLSLLIEAQSQLRHQQAEMSDQAFKSNRAAIIRQQTAIRRELLTLLLPTIPAPRSSLFDEQPPEAPPVEAMLTEVDRAITQALAQLDAGNKQASSEQQQQAEQALKAFASVVNRWSVELGIQTQGLSTLVAATSERLAIIEEYEARVIGLLEKTDIAAAEERKVDTLAETQLDLAEEMAGFNRDLQTLSQADPDRDIPPVLSRLRRAERSANAAVQSLQNNAPDEAIGHQEQAADALAEAHTIVLAQNERLSLLQDLLMFQRSIGFANGYLVDIVAEQRDLLEATEASKPEAMPVLLPKFENMRRCLEDIAPLLDLVAGRVDAGTPLAFAKTDFADAMAALQIGDKFEAVDAQDVAAESLAQVQARVKDIQTQTGYVAEIVEFLHSATADATMMQYQQAELQQKAAQATPDQVKILAEEQRALLSQAEAYGRHLVSATGMPAFGNATAHMKEATIGLELGDKPIALEQMEGAKLVLEENAESLFAVITMLHGLPSIEVTAQTEPELIRLVDVLAVASDHKQLFRQTQVADAGTFKALQDRQGTLSSRVEEIANSGDPHPLLVAASKHLAESVAALVSSDREAIRSRQKAADEKLRHFIVEQALILETAVPPPSASDAPAADGPGSDSESALSAGFISDFVSGETPKDARTEWKVLGDRNRAALNQNFARELPLEYRGLLKNYYERVAE